MASLEGDSLATPRVVGSSIICALRLRAQQENETLDLLWSVIGSWNLYLRWRESLGANLLEGLRVVVLKVSGNSDVKQFEP